MVVGNKQVRGHFSDLEQAKLLLQKQSGDRLIAEIDELGNLKRDPHKIAGQNQNNDNGFNKYWGNWDAINRMMDLCEWYLVKMRQKGTLININLKNVK